MAKACKSQQNPIGSDRPWGFELSCSVVRVLSSFIRDCAGTWYEMGFLIQGNDAKSFGHRTWAHPESLCGGQCPFWIVLTDSRQAVYGWYDGLFPTSGVPDGTWIGFGSSDCLMFRRICHWVLTGAVVILLYIIGYCPLLSIIIKQPIINIYKPWWLSGIFPVGDDG